MLLSFKSDVKSDVRCWQQEASSIVSDGRHYVYVCLCVCVCVTGDCSNMYFLIIFAVTSSSLTLLPCSIFLKTFSGILMRHHTSPVVQLLVPSYVKYWSSGSTGATDSCAAVEGLQIKNPSLGSAHARLFSTARRRDSLHTFSFMALSLFIITQLQFY